MDAKYDPVCLLLDTYDWIGYYNTKGYKKEALVDKISKGDEEEESVDTTPKGYEEAKKQKSKSRLQTNY